MMSSGLIGTTVLERVLWVGLRLSVGLLLVWLSDLSLEEVNKHLGVLDFLWLQ